MSPDEFTAIVARAAAFWPNAKFDRATVDATWRFVGALPAAAVAEALDGLAMTHPAFWPGPGPLLLAAVDAMSAPVPSYDDVLREITETVARHGWPDPPGDRGWDFSHPVVAATIRAVGGWRAVCEAPARGSEAWGTWNAQTRRSYAAVEGDYRQRRAERLAGIGGRPTVEIGEGA